MKNLFNLYKNRYMRSLLFLLLLAYFLSSCEEQQSQLEERQSQKKEKPIQDTVKKPDGVHVFNTQKSDLSCQKIDKEKIVVKKDRKTADFKVGDVLASGVSEKAPYGFLRQITRIEEKKSGLALHTKKTTLGTALKDKEINFKDKVSFTFEKSSTKTLDIDYLGDGIFELTKEITGSGGDVTNKISFTFKPEMELIWIKESGSLSPERLKMSVLFNVIDFTVTGSFGADLSHRIVSIVLPPVTIHLGIPVVFKNSLHMDIATSFEYQSVYNAGFSFEDTYFKSGVEYHDTYGWSKQTEFDYGNVELFKPENMSYKFEGTLEFPKVTLEAAPYGNPAFTFYGQTQLNTVTEYNSGNDVPLKVYDYVHCEAGINAEIFSIIDEQYSWSYNFPKWILYSGQIGNLPPLPEFGADPESGDFENITDVPDDYWAHKELKYLINNYLSGYPDNTFRPDNKLTRAEFAAMVVSIIDPKIKPEYENRDFNDIDGHWAKKAILQAARAGYLAGYPDGSFRPEEQVSKLQVLVSLSNGLQQSGGEYQEDVPDRIYDEHTIPDWAKESIANAFVNNMVINYPNKNYLRPNKDITRAEAGAIFYRSLVYLGNFVNPYNSPYLILCLE